MRASDDAARDRFSIPVNGTEQGFHDRKVTIRQALLKADLTPPSEHQAILVLDGHTKLVGTDEEIDLKAVEGGQLRVFAGDRAYSFTTDEVSQVWGAISIDVDELRDILGTPEDRELVLERDDEPDVVLRGGGIVTFGPQGVEDIVSQPRHGPDFVAVMVFTTSGIFPAEGALRVKASTLVAEVLERAARKLHLGDTSQWVVSCNGRDIDPGRSFADNGLTGTVELEWNPREGGGGDA